MKAFLMLSVAVFSLAFLVGCDKQMMDGNSIADPAIESGSRAFPGPAGDVLETQGVRYRVTIENITPATAPGASQPLSPPVLATHLPRFHVFRVGRLASDELRQIAEDAVDGPLVSKLENDGRVLDVQKGGGVILPGQSMTVEITAAPGFHRLSLVSMLVNTNDAFAALDAIRLPIFGEKILYARAYDAGTEANTELKDHIPGPCCGSPHVRVPTTEPVRMHEGITGRGDLDPQIYDWDGPVAKITIERM